MKYLLPIGLFLTVFFGNFQAQEQLNRGTKSLQATRVETAPEIDGILQEEIWNDLPVAGNFFMIEPGTSPERTTHPTRVKLFYDDEAIYVGAYLEDNEPHRILREFTQRITLANQIFLWWISILTTMAKIKPGS